MYKNIVKILNGVFLFIAFLAILGSINKPADYLPDSVIYLSSLFGICAAYLFNFWVLQQNEPQKLSTISEVINVGAILLFFLGISTKPAGGGADYVIVFLQLLPLLVTPFYLRKKS